MSDTFNWHTHLHKKEYRMSEVEILVVPSQTLIADLEIYKPEWVVDATKTYHRGLGITIKSWFTTYADYDNELVDIMAESAQVEIDN